MAVVKRMRRGMALSLLAALSCWEVNAAQAPAGGLCMAMGNEKLGWHFYCDPKQRPLAPDEGAPPTVSRNPAPQAPADPLEEIRVIQEEGERLKAEAVLRPTPENITAYIVWQQEQLERATVFSDQWRRVVWTTPELDYSVRRPINTLGKRTWSDDRRRAQQETVQRLGERYGIFFFFSGSCSYCHTFSPVLRSFADQNGLNVMAVSVDGGTLPEWPEAVVDQGQAVRLGIADKPVPAVILFDSVTRKVTPIGFGFLSHQELEERIFILTALEVGDDY